MLSCGGVAWEVYGCGRDGGRRSKEISRGLVAVGDRSKGASKMVHLVGDLPEKVLEKKIRFEISKITSPNRRTFE